MDTVRVLQFFKPSTFYLSFFIGKTVRVGNFHFSRAGSNKELYRILTIIDGKDTIYIHVAHITTYRICEQQREKKTLNKEPKQQQQFLKSGT